MLLLLLALGGVIFFYLRWRYNKARLRREAIRQIRHLQQRFEAGEAQQSLLAELSILLRNIAVKRFPEAAVAGLIEEEWLEFLDRTRPADTDPAFSQALARGLIIGPYRAADTLIDTDMQRLLLLAKRWIAANA